jgi:hypothetical protein
MSKWHGGKGSKPRPISDRKQFEDNWDRIFGNKKEEVIEQINNFNSEETKKEQKRQQEIKDKEIRDQMSQLDKLIPR